MKNKLILLVFIGMLITTSSKAQLINILKDKAISLTGKRLSKVISKEAITTSFKDCDKKNILSPISVIPVNEINLCDFESTEKGYLLKPGYYNIKLKSFCLKAGTYGPSKGDGYLYAPLKGPKEKVVSSIIKNWELHKEIPQSDVQGLLWAIISKTKFNRMPPKMQGTAMLLLSNSEVDMLTSLGLDFINQDNIQKIIGDFPKPVQMVLDAENKIRQLLNSDNYSYEEIESIAMLAGINDEKSEIQNGTWGLHPNGFYVSYHPSGYQHMVVKLYVPDNLKEVYYLPSDDVALPACTSSQRLAISSVLDCE